MGESYLNPPGPAYFTTVFYQLFIHLIYVLSSFQEGCYILQLKPESKAFLQIRQQGYFTVQAALYNTQKGEITVAIFR